MTDPEYHYLIDLDQNKKALDEAKWAALNLYVEPGTDDMEEVSLRVEAAIAKYIEALFLELL